MVAKLVLVRHGETETNVRGTLHVAGDPEKLTKKGRDQIKITAKYLCSLNPVKVYCSKEKRADDNFNFKGIRKIKFVREQQTKQSESK